MTEAEALAKTLALDPFKRIFPATRGDRQREIEDLLAGFGMDAMEAQDILGAFKAGLKRRYDEDQIPEVMEAVEELREALEELERTVMCADKELNRQDWENG